MATKTTTKKTSTVKTTTKSSASKGSTKLLNALDEILEMELSGVVRYLHYALMVRGPGRIPITKFFMDQATESLNHAHVIGNKITALGGHPTMSVKPIIESDDHSTNVLLSESLEAEHWAIELYERALPLTKGNVALEELIREFLRLEQEHVEEVEKMLIPQTESLDSED